MCGANTIEHVPVTPQRAAFALNPQHQAADLWRMAGTRSQCKPMSVTAHVNMVVGNGISAKFNTRVFCEYVGKGTAKHKPEVHRLRK